MDKYRLNITPHSVDVIDPKRGVAYHYDEDNSPTSGIVVVGENKYSSEALSSIKAELITYLRKQAPEAYEMSKQSLYTKQYRDYLKVRAAVMDSLKVDATVEPSTEPNEYYVYTPCQEISSSTLLRVQEKLSLVSVATMEKRLILTVKLKAI